MGRWIKKCGILEYYTMDYYSAMKKEGNPIICDKLDDSRGHYAKWDKPDTERQTTLFFFFNIKCFTNLHIILMQRPC